MEAFTKRGRGAAEPTGTQPAATGLRVPARGETPRFPVRLNGTLKPKILRWERWQPLLFYLDADATAPASLDRQASSGFAAARSMALQDAGLEPRIPPARRTASRLNTHAENCHGAAR